MGPLLPRNNINDMYVAMYSHSTFGTGGPGTLLGPPILIGNQPNQATGTFANDGSFNWVTIDLSNHGFGTFAPNTYYWCALLPGLTFTVNLASGDPTDTYEGVVLGGTVDQFGTILPQVAGDPLMYTSRELGSELFAGDWQNACNLTSSLTFLRAQSNWASVVGAAGRYRDSTQAIPYVAVRHGINLYGVSVGG